MRIREGSKKVNMKKKLFLLIAAVTILTGCAKANPAAGDFAKAYQESDSLSQYVAKIVEYSAATDPDQLIGSGHMYEQKLGILDSRYGTDENDPAVTIEVFSNSQDAKIRYDYFSAINEYRDAYAETNGLIIDGKSLLKESSFHLNGNILIRASDIMGPYVAEAYFKELDQMLGDGEYRQEGTVSDDEFAAIHKELVEDRQSEIEAAVKKEAEVWLTESDQQVQEILKKYESELSDENRNEAETLIQTTYSGRYFDSLRKNWQEKLDELNTLKEEKETEYQAAADELDQLLAETESDPDLEKYYTCETAVREVPDNYYFSPLKKEWYDRLTEIKAAALIVERDRNVKKINNELDQIESSLDTDLYEDVKEQISNIRYDHLYSDYVSDWLDRIKDLEQAIEEKKHKDAIKAFKDSCKKFSYKELSRNSESLKGTPVYFKGEVIQVVDQDSEGAELRVNVTKEGTYYTYYTDTVYVVYDNSDEISTSKILEDDIIEIWGLAAGDVSYTSVLGSKVTIPAILAKYIKVK